VSGEDRRTQTQRALEQAGAAALATSRWGEDAGRLLDADVVRVAVDSEGPHLLSDTRPPEDSSDPAELARRVRRADEPRKDNER
jgi:hypothetical protein